MRTYEVRTFGCQMNQHDSERIAGMLEADGLKPAAPGAHADVVVFNTCCVREHADQRLFGQVASLKSAKSAEPSMLIAVGGCIGQRDGASLVRRLPHVDVVFGTHNIAHLPDLLAAAAESSGTTVETVDPSEADFTAGLPSVRSRPWHAWVPIAVGCDNWCSYCVVPHVRGPERSRPFEDVVAEVERLVADGVVEITLLGQNVNSYGRDLYGEPRFAELLRTVSTAGPAWVRFVTSHPKDLSPDTIEAMAATRQVCRYLHLPVQSGSDAMLDAMNRRYTQADYLALVDRLYDAMPDLALSTDIIVGFPGESDADFEQTMAVVDHCRFDQAFTFIYSPREHTRAASMPGRVDRDTVQERFDRLVGAVHSSAMAKNELLVGTVRQVLIEGPSKRDPDILTGRTASNKVVHMPCPSGTAASDLAGTFEQIAITDAQTWFLLGRPA